MLSSDTLTVTSPTEHAKQVISYYRTRESRWGYQLLLGGTKHFGFYQPGQSRWRFRTAMRAAEQVLQTELALTDGARILDAGCGVGHVAINLARNTTWHITGIDLLDFNIEAAQRNAAAANVTNQTDFINQDYTTLGLTPGTYDAIYTMETLVHVENVEAAFARFYDALKPGGRLVCFEYSHIGYQNMPTRAAEAFTTINRLAAMPGFAKFADGEQIRMLTEAGFSGTVTIVTERMLPMLSALNTLAQLPYALAGKIGKRDRVVNMMSAVEFYRWQSCWSYNIISATKPI